MSFELSVADTDRDERLSATLPWRRLTIAGATRHPVEGGNHGFEIDLYGRQATKAADRERGIVAVRFVRLPSGDSFAYGEIAIDPERADWAGVLTAYRVVEAGKWGPGPWSISVDVDTRVPRLVLRNRILIAAVMP